MRFTGTDSYVATEDLTMAEDIPPEALRSQDRGKVIPPLHGALLKNEQDVHLFERLVFMARRYR
jgi:hypothetical protein